jgi:hypothetical protein
MPDKHDERYVKKAIENAWTDLLREDYQLLMKDVNERSITHKFAEHLKSQFPTWHIDCEYNRDGIDPKKVQIESRTISSDDDKAETVYPDIIVHERGKTNNLLAIEAKKDKESSDRETLDAIERDKNKLIAYKKDLRYEFGLFLMFKTGRNYKVRPKEEWF